MGGVLTILLPRISCREVNPSLYLMLEYNGLTSNVTSIAL